MGPDGRLAAIKAFDTVAERDREAGLFRRLRGLCAVPAVVDAQLELVWTEADERRVHALALEWVGPPDAGGPQFVPLWQRPRLPEEALDQVRAALAAMHKLGVAHGDVRPPNLAWDPAAGRAFVLDLGSAVTRRDATRPCEFDARCRTDLQRLDEIVAAAQAPPSAGPGS
jgi:hypothetical protein